MAQRRIAPCAGLCVALFASAAASRPDLARDASAFKLQLQTHASGSLQRGGLPDEEAPQKNETAPEVVDKEEGRVVGHLWRKGKQLGKGSFGSVWEATCANGEIPHPVSIKQELAGAKKRELDKEASILLDLQGPGIPKFYDYTDSAGMPNKERHLVMEKLGIDLENYRKKCGGKLSEAIVLQLAKQMVARFKHVHETNYYLYRDTKPNNFMLGWDPEGQHYTNNVFLIDFGLTNTYWDRQQKVHLPQTLADGQPIGFTGTQRYASMNGLRRFQQSRADDMETLGYVWAHLFTGALPWAGMKLPRRPESLSPAKRKILMLNKQVQMRQEAKDADWTYRKSDGSGSADLLPTVLKRYMNSVMSLDYEQRPKYDEYTQMIDDAAANAGIDLNSGFVREATTKDPETGEDTVSHELVCE